MKVLKGKWMYSGSSYVLHPYDNVDINIYQNIKNGELAYTLSNDDHETNIITYKLDHFKRFKLVKKLNGWILKHNIKVFEKQENGGK